MTKSGIAAVRVVCALLAGACGTSRLDEGALGIGFGINYTQAADPSEIEAMFRIAAERKVPAFVHTRAFGIAAIREAIDTAKKTGAALHIVHVGSSGITDVPEVLRLIDASKAAGMDLTTEVYPYTAASTTLESAMFNPGWQDNLKISYGDLAWAATGERLTQESFESYRKQGGWVIMYMVKDENVEKAIAHSGVMIASDGIPFVDGKGHPRGAGTFARVLGHYSMDSAGLSGKLVRSYVAVGKRGGRVVLVDLTRKVNDLLTVAKLLTVFETFDSEAAALASFKR